ncbi:MAG TPA: TRAP transporter substrate-binding protein [Alphaproteobacteria bacterium]|nr:TRAP transporter substrate-binding protein [Alphaproteobacteria bacterium]
MAVERRRFLKGAALGGVASAAAASSFPAPAISQGRMEWRMVTTWPKNFPGLGVSAERIATRIGEMTDGRLTVRVFAAGELVPAFESFDAVIGGAAEMSHGAAYYWQNKSRATNFFTGVPFGLTAVEQSAWIRYLGGQELWDELYAQFGVKGFLSGNTGTQAGGWFRGEINSVADLNGVKFRTPGLGGDVWSRLGVTIVNLPAGEIFPALQSGALDAAEFVGPYNDLALGFYQVAKNYYWTGFNEPGLATELTVNKQMYDELPADLQKIVEYACQADYEQTTAEFMARNPQSLATLVNEHGVSVREFPEDIVVAAGNAAGEVLAELRDSGDDITKRIVESYVNARKALVDYTKIAELSYMQSRLLDYTYL